MVNHGKPTRIFFRRLFEQTVLKRAEANLAAIGTRIVVYTGLWLIIAGTAPSAWLIGIPAILAAAWTSLGLNTGKSRRYSATGALRFAVFFFMESVRGGIDVARRILGVRLRIEPGFTTYHCRLPGGAPQVLFINCVSLLPGTLAADLHDDTLEVHLLDLGTDVNEELADLEQAVAEMFVITLPPRRIPGESE